MIDKDQLIASNIEKFQGKKLDRKDVSEIVASLVVFPQEDRLEILRYILVGGNNPFITEILNDIESYPDFRKELN